MSTHPRTDVSVVLPLLGEPAPLLDAVAALVAGWPDGVDAELLVPARPLEPRDRALLAPLGDDVRVLPGPAGSLGDLVTRAAAAARGPVLLVVDPAAPPAPADLPALLSGAPARGGLLLPADGLAPVLSAARDLRALAALSGGPAVAAREPAGLVAPGPGEPGLTTVVLLPGADARAATRATRLPAEVLPAGDDLASALAAARGDVVVLLEDGVVVPRFWLEGLRAALDTSGADAAGPCWGEGSAEDRRRSRRDEVLPTGALVPGCVAVRRAALPRVLTADGRPAAGAGPLVLAAQVLARRERGGPLLSAALIVKDEQAALPACLASLRGVVDEVVVCDTGSTDRTVEIAVALGARVVSAPWTGDFSAARNVALEECTGTWVLSIDADEQLVLEPGTDLRRTLATSRGEAHTVRVLSRSEAAGPHAYAHEAGRLFRRTGLRWAGAVHENLQPTGTGLPPLWSPCPGAVLHHDGYLDDVYAARDKTARNLALAEKDHASAQGTPRAWKAAYELARALTRRLDDGADPDPRLEPLLREALAGIPPGVAHLRCDAQVRLARLLAVLGRADEALETARAALATSPEDPAAALCLAGLLAGAGDPSTALAVLERRPAPEPRSAAYDVEKERVDLPRLRAALLRELGRDAEAVELLADLAAAAPERADWSGLLALATRTGRGTDRLLAAAAAAPKAALAALEGTRGADALHDALRARGVDVDACLPDAVRARQLAGAVAGSSTAAVADAARALEDEDPSAALALWRTLPGHAPAQVGAARCLLALDRATEALEAVDGVDPAALPPEDVLGVVVLAAAVGDRATAQALLDGLPDLPRPLADRAAALAAELDLVLA